MAKYVFDLSVMLHVLREGLPLPPDHEVLAPTLLRSQVLDALYREVRTGELDEDAGLARLATFASMKIRYLGDKVLRRQAWAVASELGWDATYAAEAIALTQLQADALVTLDPQLAEQARALVPIAELEGLY